MFEISNAGENAMRRLSVCFATLTALLVAAGTAAQAQLREAPLRLSDPARADAGEKREPSV